MLLKVKKEWNHGSLLEITWKKFMIQYIMTYKGFVCKGLDIEIKPDVLKVNYMTEILQWFS